MSIPQSTNNCSRFLRILFLMGGKLLYSVVLFSLIVAVVQWPSPVRLFATPWAAARQASLSSPSSGVCPNSCSLHRWCHPASSSSDALFSFCPQSFPASGTFPVSRLFALDDQNTGALASASVLPVNIQGSSPLRLTGLISLLSKGLSGVFSSTTVRRHQFFGVCLLYSPALTTVCDHQEDHGFDLWTL